MAALDKLRLPDTVAAHRANFLAMFSLVYRSATPDASHASNPSWTRSPRLGRRRWKFSLWLALLVLLPKVGFAQTAAELTTARNLAREGQQALIDGDFDTSADRFERAAALVHAPTLLLGLARARVGQGRLVEAYELYQKIVREGVTDDAPEAFKRAVAAAGNEVQSLESRLAWITITTTGLEGDAKPHVTINGTPISNAFIGVRRPVDPGTVIVRAEAEGYEPAELSFQVTEGENDAVAALELVPLPKPDPVEESPPPMSSSKSVEFDTQTTETPIRTLSYIAMGLGGATMIAGTVTGLIAYSKQKELESSCSNGDCPPQLAPELNDYETYRVVALVGLAGGALIAGGGVAAYFLFPEQEQQAGIHPYLSPTGFGLVGRF